MVEVIKKGVWHNGAQCAVGDTLTLSAADEERLVADGWCKSVKKSGKKGGKSNEGASGDDAPSTNAPGDDG